jgi:hypothetical protein
MISHSLVVSGGQHTYQMKGDSSASGENESAPALARELPALKSPLFPLTSIRVNGKEVIEMPRGRKPIGSKALTPSERVARYRKRHPPPKRLTVKMTAAEVRRVLKTWTDDHVWQTYRLIRREAERRDLIV